MTIPKQLKQLSFCRIKKGSKAPFEKDWNNKPYSYDEISKFFPGENYGVLCGYHDLAVIDCDEDSLSLVVDQLLPETFAVKTGGGGKHFYYFIPELKQKVILNLGDTHLGEIQFKGQQVVGVSSLHPNGKTYEIINDVGIKTITLARLKEVLGQFMEKDKVALDEKENIEEYDKLVQEIVKVWKEGDRQELALSMAGYLRKDKRLGINKVKSIIKEVCEITKDEEVKMRLRAVEETFKKDESKVKGYSGLKKVDLKKGLVEKDFTYTETIKGKPGEEDREIIKVSIDKIADYLIDQYKFKTILGTKTDKIFFYSEGMYCSKGKNIIRTKVESLVKTKARTNIVNEVIEKIKRKTEIQEDAFDNFSTNNLDLINLKNGVYSIKKKKLLDHSEEYLFAFQIPVNYKPEAACPLFIKFLNEILYPEDVEVILEWFGFNLYRKYFIKKGLILDGAKDTGKTTLLDILIYFIGEKNKTGIPLQKITSGSDFTKLSLRNKHSNIYDDLSSKDLSDGGGFKIATGGGHISAEEKFGDYVQFVSFAKQSHATNKIPPNQDKGDTAYYSRWLPIKLDNPPEKIDPFLRGKITTPEELSGILNLSLDKLNNLLQTGKFSFDKTDEEVEEIMERSGNPLLVFASDVLEESPAATITKEVMYQAYSKWAKDNTRPRLSKEQLGRRLEINCKFIIAKRGAGKVGRFWEGAKFKGAFDTFDTFKKTI